MAVGFAINPITAQAGILDIFDPLKISQILTKTKGGFKQTSQEILLNEQGYFGFSLMQNDSVLATRSPITPKTYKPKEAYIVAATGYSSTPEETDHTPFITAAGTHVRDGVIATNFLPFGTVIKIPELFGDRTFIVEDRMNNRYWMNIDIWFAEKELAKEFGKRVVKIEIL